MPAAGSVGSGIVLDCPLLPLILPDDSVQRYGGALDLHTQFRNMWK